MRSKIPLRKISKNENLSIFLVLLVIIAAGILVEFFTVRSMDITKVAFIKPMNICKCTSAGISYRDTCASHDIDHDIGRNRPFYRSDDVFYRDRNGFSDQNSGME